MRKPDIPSPPDPAASARLEPSLSASSSSSPEDFRLLSSVDPAAREELTHLVSVLKARAAEVSAFDRRPYGRSVEHAIKQLLIRASHGKLPEAPASQPEPVAPPAPEPSGPVVVEPPETVQAAPTSTPSLNVLR